MITPSSSGIPMRKPLANRSEQQPRSNLAERLQAEIDRHGKLRSNSSSPTSLNRSETGYSERNRSDMVKVPGMTNQPGQKTPTGKHNGASVRVFAYLRENANTEVPLVEIQKALGLPSYTVTNSIGHLISKGVPITRPMQGVAIFRPGTNPQNRQTTQLSKPEKPLRGLYEFVGKSQGRVIVKGEDDELYILSPLFAEEL